MHAFWMTRILRPDCDGSAEVLEAAKCVDCPPFVNTIRAQIASPGKTKGLCALSGRGSSRNESAAKCGESVAVSHWLTKMQRKLSRSLLADSAALNRSDLLGEENESKPEFAVDSHENLESAKSPRNWRKNLSAPPLEATPGRREKKPKIRITIGIHRGVGDMH